MVSENLMEFPYLRKIVIHSDSQAALQALNNLFVMIKMALAMMLSLHALDKKQVVLVQWVRAHVGLTRNKKWTL
jgi:ribonuclease HI